MLLPNLQMGLLSVLATVATAVMFLFSPAITVAQTLSSPLTIDSVISSGESVYIYNPASQSIVSPVEYTNELTMVPWQSYNSSMQWNITEPSGPSVFINAVFG